MNKSFYLCICIVVFHCSPPVCCQVDGVSEIAHSTLCLLLDLYEMDCKQFCDTKKALYFTLLARIMKLPWEAKAKYHRLCALLPYLGSDKVRI